MIYVYLQFKSEFKENYLALTSLKIPLYMYVTYHLPYLYDKVIKNRDSTANPWGSNCQVCYKREIALKPIHRRFYGTES